MKRLIMFFIITVSVFSFAATTRDNVARLERNGIYGEKLQNIVRQRVEGIMPYNRPYIFNGVQDCYGSVRQTWNAILYDGGAHPEDFSWGYDKSRWMGVNGGLPVATAPDSDWQPIRNLNDLRVGDILATHQGHAWGADWHGGMYAGKDSAGRHYQWDNSHIDGLNGFYKRNFWSGFRYYYVPVHNLLAKEANITNEGVGNKVIGVKRNGASGFTEVYVLNKQDNYGAYIQENTALQQTGNEFVYAAGDYNNDGTTDLYAVKKIGTGTGTTEVHILNGADNYKSFLCQTGTGLGCTGDNWEFLVKDYNGDGKPDLICIVKSNTGSGKTEVHILNGADNFKTFLLHTATGFGYTDKNWKFAMADYNGDGRLDLYGIVKNNTGSGKSEVHVLSGSDNFQTFILHTATALGYCGDNWEFGIADYNNDRKPDFYAITKSSTGSGKTEVHILNGSDNFQSFLLHTATGMGYTDNQVQFFPCYDKEDSNLKYFDSRIFDRVFYKNKYQDLANAFGNDWAALKNHWLTYGMGEGRQACSNFDVKSYLDRYVDLKNAFGTNYRAGIDHYLNYGIREGRSGILSAFTIEVSDVVNTNITITVSGSVPSGITKVKGYIDDTALVQGEATVVNGRYQFPMVLIKTGSRTLKVVGTGNTTLTAVKNITVK